MLDQRTGRRTTLQVPCAPDEAIYTGTFGSAWLLFSCVGSADAAALDDLADGTWNLVSLPPSLPECGPTGLASCTVVGGGAEWIKVRTGS